jgi:hypothetical protein
MKKVSIRLTDVDVQLIKFVKEDPYQDFDVLENRKTEDIKSEIEEIQRLQDQRPIAFFKRNDGSYILITSVKEELV